MNLPNEKLFKKYRGWLKKKRKKMTTKKDNVHQIFCQIQKIQ